VYTGSRRLLIVVFSALFSGAVQHGMWCPAASVWLRQHPADAVCALPLKYVHTPCSLAGCCQVLYELACLVLRTPCIHATCMYMWHVRRRAKLLPAASS
jgi:hypothetical protein